MTRTPVWTDTTTGELLSQLEEVVDRVRDDVDIAVYRSETINQSIGALAQTAERLAEAQAVLTVILARHRRG